MRRTLARSISSIALLVALIPATTAAGDSLPRVPVGFTIEKVAGSPLVKHPMLAGFDDRGRLFVASSAGHNLKADALLEHPPNFIQMLEDTDGDGRFDKSTVFADKMTLPMGALWYRGALYVASPPYIWRLEDTDGDGVADKREILVEKFGFTGNAADIHGCFLGPTGRIYWCDGRHGHEFRDREGRLTSKGKAARIFSCRPDGSDVRVFCGGGMDNPVEIDFTEEGEMLGTANILLNPRGDCLVHWVEGGVYPRHDQEDCLDEFQRTGELLPPVADLGHVAVSGMTRYRSDHFGPEYTGNVFITEFNTHKVTRSVLTRSGATFTSKEEDFLVSDDPDFHPTDVLEDADGSLLVIDTGGWFRIGCPVSKVAKPEIHGAIYRIRRTGRPIAEDPWGLKLGLENLSNDDLPVRLDDPRPAVREKAIDLLAQRDRDEILPRLVAIATSPVLCSARHRRNAVWTLGRIGGDSAASLVELSSVDADPSVRAAAARVAGILGSRYLVAAPVAILQDDSLAVRREVATALGRLCEPGANDDIREIDCRNTVDALLQSVEKSNRDRMLEHALIYAVIRVADRGATIPYLRHDNPAVRRAALIALDQMNGGNLTREMIVPLLDTDDPALQKAALEIIARRKGWAAETLDLLRTWMAEATLSEERESILRGLLLAQAADAEIQKLVAETLSRSELAPPLRLLLLEVIHRSVLEELPASWTAAVERALKTGTPEVRLQALRVVQDRQLERFDPQLEALSRDDRQPADLRVEALIALAPRLKSLGEPLFAFLLDRLKPDLPALTRLATARALADAPLEDRQLLQLADRLDDAGPLAVPVLLRAFSRTSNEKVGLALVAALDRSSAASSLSPEELARLVSSYPGGVRKAADGLLKRLGVDPEAQQARLAALAPLLTGGDAARGRQVFFGRKAACAGCHTVASEGAKVGPDLTTIGSIRTGHDLLEALAFPSATFARGYRSYIIVTDEGRIHTGVISRQTSETVYLRTADLAEIRIPRRSIEEMKESPASIMPKGLDKSLTPDEMRDLLAFLQSLTG